MQTRAIDELISFLSPDPVSMTPFPLWELHENGILIRISTYKLITVSFTSMTESKARQLVQDYLDRLSADEGYYVILRIIEKKYGWVIYWNTKKYAESGNRADGEIGTGPLVIENSSGSIYSLSSGINQVKILCDFEKAHGYTS